MKKEIMTKTVMQGDVATVAVEKVAFLLPIPVGSFIDITAEVAHVGNTSLRVEMNVWLDQHDGKNVLAGKAEFVYVALDGEGNSRKIARTKEE